MEMIDIEALKKYAYDTIGAIHEVHKEFFYPRFAEIERYFYNSEDNEIYGSDGFPIRKYV